MTDDSPSGGDPAVTEAATLPADGHKKAGDIRTVEELIAFAYDQEGKRFSVPSSVLESLHRSPVEQTDINGIDRSVELIVQLAEFDRLLAVPLRLLVAVEDGGAPAALRRRLAGLVAMVLREHPVFQDEGLRTALQSEPADVDALVTRLRSAVARVSPDRLGLRVEKLTTSERERLSANAVAAFLFVLAVRDGWSLEKFVETFHSNVWASADASRKPEALLADSRTPDALGLVANVYSGIARNAKAEAIESEEYAQRAARRAAEADEAVSVITRTNRDLQSRVENLVNQVSQLESVLSSERKSRLVDKSHHVDDYETLRTRVQRMLDRQIDLLADGLHALRNGSTSVTEEYLERAIEAFGKERDQLRAEEADRR
jgi:hypothetical protein